MILKRRLVILIALTTAPAAWSQSLSREFQIKCRNNDLCILRMDSEHGLKTPLHVRSGEIKLDAKSSLSGGDETLKFEVGADGETRGLKSRLIVEEYIKELSGGIPHHAWIAQVERFILEQAAQTVLALNPNAKYSLQTRVLHKEGKLSTTFVLSAMGDEVYFDLSPTDFLVTPKDQAIITKKLADFAEEQRRKGAFGVVDRFGKDRVEAAATDPSSGKGH